MFNTTLKSLLARTLTGTLVALGTAGAATAAFPEKPIRLVIPFPAGGSSDAMGRVVAQGMAERLGQPVVVENRAGASGTIATNYVANAEPDGYTLCYCLTGSLVILPMLNPNLTYKPDTQLTPVSHVASQPFVVVVQSNLKANTLQDYVKQAKGGDGKLTFGSPGVGTPSHLTGELFNQAAGINVRHIPYRGDAPAVQDLLGGQIDAMYAAASNVPAMTADGRTKALAVSTPKRLSLLPDVPTIAESGYPGFETATMQIIVAPAGTPGNVVEKLSQAVRDTLKSPEVLKKADEQGLMVVASSPAEAAATLKAENERLSPIVKKLDIRIN